jgi:peptidoglycan/xylan/chitin deacetylase (PgdA/CDA1 family)
VRRALTVSGLVLLLGVPVGCGGSSSSSTSGAGGSSSSSSPSQQPIPAPPVTLTAEDKQVWVPTETPPGIPTLLYHGIDSEANFQDPADAQYALNPEDFAKQMALLHNAGYHTVTLAQFANYVAGRPEKLPPHPLLITFDDALTSSYLNGDSALKREGFIATMFVDAYRVDTHAKGYLDWDQLRTMAKSGRWDMQLHSWLGHQYIRYGPGANDVGAFYAYRKEGESLDGWRKRAFGDIEEGAANLRDELPDQQAIAFAPPYGNYGQEGTNDKQIPEELLSWLLDRYQIVFVQNECIFSTPHEKQPLGRFQLTRATTGGVLHERLLKPC